MSAELTADEMFESLNGFDEIAVTNSFGMTVMELVEKNQMMFLRSLIFVDFRRKGQNDHDAKKSSMDLTIKDVSSYFVESEDEVDPEDPVTEPGKDDVRPV